MRMVTADALGAWLLKRNGDTSDIAAPAARPKLVRRWCVHRSYRTGLKDAGQAVLFWVSGSRRGSAPACGRSKLAVRYQATVAITAINEWL